MSSSKSTVLAEKARGLFNDYHCEVRFFKGVGPLCTYFASRGEFTTFGLYSQEQIRVMAHRTRYHKKIGCADVKNPSQNSGKRYNSYFRPWSTWFVIKRSALVAVVFKIMGLLFDTVKSIIDETVAQYFPQLTDFIRHLMSIIMSWEEGEGAPASSTPDSSNNSLSGQTVALFFVGLALLSLIRVLANSAGS